MVSKGNSYELLKEGPPSDYARALVNEMGSVDAVVACRVLGFHRSTLHRRLRDDETFPRAFRHTNSPRARLRFFVSELIAWQRSKQSDSARVRHGRVMDGPKAANNAAE